MNANRNLKRKYRLMRTERRLAAELREKQISPSALILISNIGHGYLAKREGTLIERYLWVIEQMREVKRALGQLR